MTTFWEHLDELRMVLWRCVVFTIVMTVVAFVFGEVLFDVILAPSHSDFIVYRVYAMLGFPVEAFHVDLVNTGLARQFVLHLEVAVYTGVLMASPYILYCIFHFVSPGLYTAERHYSRLALIAGWLMFLVGALVAYFLVFPLTFRFLGTYQVSAEIANYITLDSYLDTLFVMVGTLGLVFEFPLLCYVLSRLGLIQSQQLQRYHRHAITAVVILAAVITPTGDPFTLALTSLPMLLLYELSIVVVKRSEK
ncbi:MAG: twin-arginine translocase subunit TatC [Bacteroidaceae bacterium]|nr:twin-arginine translocase subunit TatC [Bacteroidaceae bacterium]